MSPGSRRGLLANQQKAPGGSPGTPGVKTSPRPTPAPAQPSLKVSMNIHYALVAVLLACAPIAGHRVAPAAEPLNVVFILADDLGCRDLGCYGSTFHETPAIDGLAREGVRFTTAYAACPVCSPTRASILTGRYPPRTGVTDFIGAAQPPKWNRNTPHLPAAYAEKLALEEVTLAERLKANGYATFFCGKWHLGGEGFLPEDQGFDVNRGGGAASSPRGKIGRAHV